MQPISYTSFYIPELTDNFDVRKFASWLIQRHSREKVLCLALGASLHIHFACILTIFPPCSICRLSIPTLDSLHPRWVTLQKDYLFLSFALHITLDKNALLFALKRATPQGLRGLSVNICDPNTSHPYPFSCEALSHKYNTRFNLNILPVSPSSSLPILPVE